MTDEDVMLVAQEKFAQQLLRDCVNDVVAHIDRSEEDDA